VIHENQEKKDMSIGTTKLCHVAIIVKDIKKAVDNWSKVLGLPKAKIFNLPPSLEVPAFTGEALGDYSDVKLATYQLENCVIELAQPGGNSSPWKNKFDKQGECVQHLSFIVPDRKKAQDELKALGAGTPYHIGYWPNGTYSFTDTVSQLGVEINIKTNDDNTVKKEELLRNPSSHKKDL
jgi:catechol 2,3-dioxygenase-like lactoylglutathione lyase family enzyme